MKHKFFAVAAAAALLAALPVSAFTAFGAAMRDDIPAPDWVPQNFAQGMSFLKTYGATHIEDDVACFVRVEYDYPQNKYKTTVHHTGLEGRTDTDPYVWEKRYDFEAPAPLSDNPSNAELDGYNHLCQLLGWDPKQAGDPDSYKAPFHLTVHAYKVVPGTTLYVNTEARGAEFNTLLSTHTYSFAFNEDLTKLEETDIYGWLPDCEREFDEFNKENEAISVHNNYIVFADEIPTSSGYQLIPSLTGTALAQTLRDDYVEDYVLMPPDGGTERRLQIYKPIRPGVLQATFDILHNGTGSFENPNGGAIHYVSVFEIDNDLNIKPYNGKAESYYPGDCNGDNELSVSDSVTFLKYLSGDGTLKNWQAADLNEDGTLNAADLTIQKRRIIENSSPTPSVSKLVAVEIVETGFRSIQTIGHTCFFKATIAYANCVDAAPKQASALTLYNAENDKPIAEFTQDEENGYYVLDVSVLKMSASKVYAGVKFYDSVNEKPEDAVMIKSNVVMLHPNEEITPAPSVSDTVKVDIVNAVEDNDAKTFYFKATAPTVKATAFESKMATPLTLYDAETDKPIAEFTTDQKGNYILTISDEDMPRNSVYAAAKFYNAVSETPEDAVLIKSPLVGWQLENGDFDHLIVPSVRNMVKIDIIEIAERAIQKAEHSFSFTVKAVYKFAGTGFESDMATPLTLYNADTDEPIAEFTLDEATDRFICTIPYYEMPECKVYAAAKFYNVAKETPDDAILVKSDIVNVFPDPDAPPVFAGPVTT